MTNIGGEQSPVDGKKKIKILLVPSNYGGC